MTNEISLTTASRLLSAMKIAMELDRRGLKILFEASKNYLTIKVENQETLLGIKAQMTWEIIEGAVQDPLTRKVIECCKKVGAAPEYLEGL